MESFSSHFLHELNSSFAVLNALRCVGYADANIWPRPLSLRLRRLHEWFKLFFRRVLLLNFD